MENFDLATSLKQSAVAYYRHEYNLASILLRGSIRRIAMLPLDVQQAAYLNNTIEKINSAVNRCDYIGLGDIVHFEFIQNFPNFESLIVQEGFVS